MKKTTFTPINILWIEDNPLTNSLSAEIVNKRVGKELFDYSLSDIPAINFKGENEDCFRFFDLKILQHPEEIKEYIKLCNLVEDKYGPVALGELDGVIPEIVAFDYQLADNIAINMEGRDKFYIPYDVKWKSVRKYFNPNFKILEKYKLLTPHLESSNIKYKVDDFIKRINYIKTGEQFNVNKDKSELVDNTTGKGRDDLGLYSGIEVLRLFRNHACIGIPATRNKAKRESLHSFSKYYEWLNENDLSTALDRKERDNKSWDSIIKDGVKQLKIRIINLVETNKITLNLSQLMEYAGDNIPKEPDKRILSFQTAYGVRHLPLDGLFIDSPKKERELAIAEWAKIVLQIFKTGPYKTARDISTKLIQAYQAVPVIRNRVRLSELAVKLCNNETLSSKEDNNLTDLMVEFGIGNPQITNCINNGKADGDNLTNKVVEYREVKASENAENRLIILFTDLQLHKVWQNFCKMNENAILDGQISALLKSPPTLDDLRAALFPIPKNPLVLPYHYHLLNDKTKFKSKDPFDVWDKHLGRDMEDNKGIFYKSEYPKNISSGEKQLALSFALDIGLENKYHPSWFKK